MIASSLWTWGFSKTAADIQAWSSLVVLSEVDLRALHMDLDIFWRLDFCVIPAKWLPRVVLQHHGVRVGHAWGGDP